MDIKTAKRHAKILSKEADLKLSAAQEIIARMNGSKHWHEFQKTKSQPPASSLKEKHPPVSLVESMHIADAVYDVASGMFTPDKEEDEKSWEIKVKAIAEAKIYFKVKAETKEEALEKAEAHLEVVEEADIGYEYPDWEVSYIHSIPHCEKFKVTSAYNHAKKEHIEDDYEGLLPRKVRWPL